MNRFILRESAGDDGIKLSEDYVIHRVLDKPSRGRFDRLYSQLIAVFLALAFFTYVSFKLIPDSILNLLLESRSIKSLIERVPLDYNSFHFAGNSLDAGRTWSTEFAILIWLIAVLIWIAVESLRLAYLNAPAFEKLRQEPLLQKGFMSALLALLFLAVYPFLGISGKLIAGQYRVSFGPNDFAILWFVALAFMAVAASWMAFFFLAAVISKISHGHK